ncbi:MAG: hypothetical protein WA144_15490 [Candidatus Methanoperedens sp.]
MMSFNKLELLSAMTNMGKFTKPQQPANNIAQFIAESFDKLFGTPTGEIIIFKNILIMQANADPQTALQKLITFQGVWEDWTDQQAAEAGGRE